VETKVLYAFTLLEKEKSRNKRNKRNKKVGISDSDGPKIPFLWNLFSDLGVSTLELQAVRLRD
jgi:hypothetical protein